MDEKQILNTLMEWRNRLSSIAYAVIKDGHLAEDLFQNLLLKALKTDASFENEKALISWSVVTIRRGSIDLLRKRKRELMVLDDEVLDLIDSQIIQTPFASENKKQEALETCLTSLTDRANLVLKLRYFYGHTCDEVAKKTGMSQDAIYKLISRTHHKLKNCIEVKLKGLTTT